MKTEAAPIVKTKGRRKILVVKKKTNPSAMEMGSAGRALFARANKRSVKNKPVMMAIKQVKTVIMSYKAALPTRTL